MTQRVEWALRDVRENPCVAGVELLLGVIEGDLAELERRRDEDRLLAAVNGSDRIGVHDLGSLMALLTQEHHALLPGNERTVDPQGMIHEIVGYAMAMRRAAGEGGRL